MRKKTRICTKALAQKLLVCAVAVTLAIAPLAFGQSSSGPRPDDRVVRERVDALLKQMTLEEKIGQLSQLFDFGEVKKIDEAVAGGHVGSLLFVTDPAEINRFQHVAVDKTRVHIPLIFGYDVIHGFRTIFPVPIAMAASWDPTTVTTAQSIAAKEARAVGIGWAFAPMLDIARDPRWGRIVEGAGEDPYLGSAIAAAQVRGFQGEYIGAPDHILACMKHFAGYGAAEGGRDYYASYIPESQMYNVYLPPFHAAVKAGIGSAMSAYMDLNDVPATGNHWLLHDVLRDQWNFTGFVVSDANSVKSLEKHHYAKDLSDAAVRAFKAGVNMEMAIDFNAYSRHLAAAVQDGQITLQEIEAADRPILETEVRLGLFDHPYVDEARSQRILSEPEHRTSARLAVERSAVLLRNEGGLLPLKKSAYTNIAVIGPLADSQLDTLGSWAFQQDLKETVTVLGGLRDKLGPQVKLTYTPGVQIYRKFRSFFDDIFKLKPAVPWTAEQTKAEMSKAINLASSSDLTILVLGEAQNMSGEAASRESLDLPGREEQLLEAVAATHKPVVLVLLNGRPLNITQSPEEQGKRYWDEESTPLYPFGYGLSYSTFAFSDLKVSQTQIKPGESIDVTFDVENTGTSAADEVAQLYVHQRFGSASRPVRELKGFERITLAPHAKKTVHMSLGTPELSYWSTATKDWVEEPADFDIWVGGNSEATLHATFEIKQ